MVKNIAGELYESINRQIAEIMRQIHQPSGYPFDAGQLQMYLQSAIEGKFGVTTPSVSPSSQFSNKFTLFVDLGIITVPDDYDHATAIKSFIEKNNKEFYHYDDDIADENFKNPTRILKPGDKLHVRAFQQIIPGMTTSEERMAFLTTQNAVHVGAQGLSLVFDQKRDQLPKSKWYVSFDEKDRLFKDAGGYHRVPHVIAYSGGGFGFFLGYFGDVWNNDCTFLCFCDLETEPLVA